MKKLFTLLAAAAVLSACDAEVEVPEEIVRSVKTLTVTEASRANSRQISGIVSSRRESSLSFRVGGRVASAEASLGDEVVQGQVLASLEKREYELAVDTAQARLASARAELEEKSETLRRQNNLRQRDFVPQAAVDQAQLAFSTAESSVRVAESNLKNAQDDLDNTTLRAPFAGTVAAKDIDTFSEITAGQTVFELQDAQGFDVDVLMPESLIRDVTYGDVVTVRFPILEDAEVAGVVTKIGARAENGNAFPITVALAEEVADVRAGLTAQVTFNFGETSDTPVYLIPVSALDLRIPVEAGSRTERQAPVFIFDEEQQTAKQRMVTIRDIRGNEFEVIDGLGAGDVLIVAGVPFLTDGQRVKQWQPNYNVPAVIQQ